MNSKIRRAQFQKQTLRSKLFFKIRGNSKSESEMKNIKNEVLKQSVGDSFNIYQGTIAVLSIFLGFVFAALLQLLVSSDGDLSPFIRMAVIFLVIANLSLLGALFFFHITANQVVRYWKIFFPKSFAQSLGSILLAVGISCMQLGIAVLLWGKGMCIMSVILCFATLGILSTNYIVGKLHKVASYVRIID